MALDKDTLISDLKDMRNILKSIENEADADEQATELLASAIEKFIKSGTVNFASGKVTGTCPSGGGPLTLGTATEGEIS